MCMNNEFDKIYSVHDDNTDALSVIFFCLWKEKILHTGLYFNKVCGMAQAYQIICNI